MERGAFQAVLAITNGVVMRLVVGTSSTPDAAACGCHCRHQHTFSFCLLPPPALFQGMSDLLSPLLVVAGGDEAAAYALFSALMARLEPNFSADAAGNAMGAQLAALRRLVQVGRVCEERWRGWGGVGGLVGGHGIHFGMGVRVGSCTSGVQVVCDAAQSQARSCLAATATGTHCRQPCKPVSLLPPRGGLPPAPHLPARPATASSTPPSTCWRFTDTRPPCSC
jgi:hypothetical protein